MGVSDSKSVPVPNLGGGVKGRPGTGFIGEGPAERGWIVAAMEGVKVEEDE